MVIPPPLSLSLSPYIVGSTNDGLSCRMLKIDRTQSGAAGLVVEEDEKEYQQNEVEGEREGLLIMYDYLLRFKRPSQC